MKGVIGMEELYKLYAKSNGETIRQHTDNLLSAFDDFVSLYGQNFNADTLKTIRYACEYHDYGKAVYIFQKIIKNNEFLNQYVNKKETEELYKKLGFEKGIPHGYFSPAFMNYKELKSELGEEKARILYTAVFYHHNRDTQVDSDTLKKIIQGDLALRYGRLPSNYRQFILTGNINDEIWIQYATILGMLNKFDYYASETKSKYPVEINGEYNGKFIGDYVYEYITQKFSLRDVQQYMLESRNENVIITASTGIGKTEASLLWADKSKVFYTLPLKVSINAMYDRICTAYGYSKDKVTLLHSDCLSHLSADESADTSEVVLKYDASRRFSYPITVCTIDQLFSFVYKYRGSEILTATLKYSKIIIDEIQSYEPKLIAKLIYGLSLIAKSGGKFAIITATLPPILMYFIDKRMSIPHKEPRQFLLTSPLRHKIRYEQADDFDYNKIALYGKNKKVLVICNTVKRACNVYENLKELSDDVHLLHAKFIRKHLNLLECEILRFASDSTETGIWVTTQIVEASLDIDFDILFTEMCTADSLLQRMGRCYRKREYTDSDPNVYIIDNKNGYGTVYKYKDIYDRSAEMLSEYNDKLFSEQDKMNYVDSVYDTESLMKNNSQYFQDISKELNDLESIAPFEISKSKAKELLRNIQSFKVIPESEYNRNIDEFEKNYNILTDNQKHTFTERNNARQFIEDYSVNLGNYDYRSKEKSHSIFSKLDYYTTNYKYDFDEEKLCGKGLDYDKDEEESFL